MLNNVKSTHALALAGYGFIAIFSIALCSAPSWAGSICSSDGSTAPMDLLERFIPADCVDCWRQAEDSDPHTGTAVIDWIVPAGEDAPLAAAATEDAHRRLRAIAPRRPDARGRLHSDIQNPEGLPRPVMRVAHGPAVNDYVGASLRWSGTVPVDGTAWLLLVEAIPAGDDGSRMARRLVRNLLMLPVRDFSAAPVAPVAPDGLRPGGTTATTFQESRSMRFPEGAQPERLEVIGWIEDADGQVIAAAASDCGQSPPLQSR